MTVPVRPSFPSQVLDALPPKEEPPKEAPQDGKRSKVPRAKAPHIHDRKKPRPARESFTLAPLEIRKDRPNTRGSYTQMLRLMSGPSDFKLIPAFLQELRAASLPVTPGMLAKTVRRSAELGSLGTVVRMFQSINTIGIQVNHPEIVQALTSAIVRNAASGHWTQSRLDQSSAYAASLLTMLRDPRHHFPTRRETLEDSKDSAYVWGTVMALDAVRTLRYGPSELTAQRTYTLSTLAESFLERLDPTTFSQSLDTPALQNKWLAAWAPAIVGTEYAIQALTLADPITARLQSVLPALKEALSTISEAVRQTEQPGQSRLGLIAQADIETALVAQAPEALQSEQAAELAGGNDAADNADEALKTEDRPSP